MKTFLLFDSDFGYIELLLKKNTFIQLSDAVANGVK